MEVPPVPVAVMSEIVGGSTMAALTVSDTAELTEVIRVLVPSHHM